VALENMVDKEQWRKDAKKKEMEGE